MMIKRGCVPARMSLAAASAMVLVGCGALGGLGGCRSTYSADIRNQTPQPVFAQIFERQDDGRTPVVAEARFGPGDRGVVGPVRTRTGRTGLVIDTRPNPGPPVMLDLRPGMSYFNVYQKGEGTAGPLEVREVTP